MSRVKQLAPGTKKLMEHLKFQGRISNSYRPFVKAKAVGIPSSGLSPTCQYPEVKFKVEDHQGLSRASSVSSAFGKGYQSLLAPPPVSAYPQRHEGNQRFSTGTPEEGAIVGFIPLYFSTSPIASIKTVLWQIVVHLRACFIDCEPPVSTE